LKEGKLYFLNTPDPNRPIENKYVVEFDDIEKSFEKEQDALIFMFDNGVTNYQFLSKKLSKYKSLKNIQRFEFWHLENRVGYVSYDYERYYDENDKMQKRRAYVWRFIGYGRSQFAETREELEDKVLSLIHYYKEDPAECGHNIYPYYTRYYVVKRRSSNEKLHCV
jgi:hypothetical protein